MKDAISAGDTRMELETFRAALQKGAVSPPAPQLSASPPVWPSGVAAPPDRWTRTAGARGNDEYQALARFGEDVIAAGHTQPDRDYGTQNPHELTTFQAVLARYGPDGALHWSQTAGGEQTVLMSVEVDGAAIFVAGHARGPASFAGAALQSGVFVLEIDPVGRAVSTSQCAADPGGRRYVRGLAVVRGRATVVGVQDFGGRMEPFIWRLRSAD